MTLFQWLIFIWKLDLEKMTWISSTWFQSGLKRWPRVYFWQELWCMKHAQFWTYHPQNHHRANFNPWLFFSIILDIYIYIGLYYPLIWLLWGLYSANIRIFIHQSSISWFMSYQGFDVICSFAIPHAERVISRKPMMLSVWPYRVLPLVRPKKPNLLLPHGHQQRLRSSRSAWNLGDWGHQGGPPDPVIK